MQPVAVVAAGADDEEEVPGDGVVIGVAGGGCTGGAPFDSCLGEEVMVLKGAAVAAGDCADAVELGSRLVVLLVMVSKGAAASSWSLRGCGSASAGGCDAEPMVLTVLTVVLLEMVPTAEEARPKWSDRRSRRPVVAAISPTVLVVVVLPPSSSAAAISGGRLFLVLSPRNPSSSSVSSSRSVSSFPTCPEHTATWTSFSSPSSSGFVLSVAGDKSVEHGDVIVLVVAASSSFSNDGVGGGRGSSL